ncbi:hypothetical protein M0R45_019538 [Rubus argutus]|uniref:Uncharacterized protein n=1 Tax=Rubus argutus TaxID=59490 RepID=A0AAW1X9C9_RUBAR
MCPKTTHIPLSPSPSPIVQFQTRSTSIPSSLHRFLQPNTQIRKLIPSSLVLTQSLINTATTTRAPPHVADAAKPTMPPPHRRLLLTRDAIKPPTVQIEAAAALLSSQTSPPTAQPSIANS